MSKSGINRINELYDFIQHHADCYYNQDAPEITDAEYDALVRELRALEAANPDLARTDFLTHQVGGQASELFSKVKHAVPMLSLDNVFNTEELENFFTRISKEAAMIGGFTCELKIDGLAVSLIYEDGVFVRGATRGNGHIGEDVTQNLLQIESLPKRLRNAPKGRVEVRGEVLIKSDRFKSINQLREERGEALFANPRNAAAGTLRQKEQDIVRERGLDIFLYYLVNAESFGIKSQFHAIKWLEDHGLPTQPAYKFCANITNVQNFIEEWATKRHGLDYVTDGVVIKLNDLTRWSEIGSTSHAPRWAVAYKYPPEEKETKLNNIEISIGRTGILTPVAVFEPVNLAGTVVQRASLHNADEIERKDIRIGDVIRVRKAAEIIPEVVSSNKAVRTGTEEAFIMPARCPICGAEVIRLPDEAAHRCVNTTSCPAQLKESLKHFASRDAMDIKGLGDSLAAKLIDADKIKSLLDIYRLRLEDWLSLDKVQKKTASNIMAGIEASKHRPLENILTALSIPDVGKSVAGLLVDHFNSIDAIAEASELEIASIEGVGAVIANSVYEFFRKNQGLMHQIKELGINTMNQSKHLFKNQSMNQSNFEEVSEVSNEFFSNKTFVFTGTLMSLTRDEASAKVKSLGAKVSGSVSSKTDYLVIGDKPGSKLQKAERLGIKILIEDDFLQQLLLLFKKS